MYHQEQAALGASKYEDISELHCCTAALQLEKVEQSAQTFSDYFNQL